VRYGFTQALWAWAYPGSQAVPRFETWSEVFETAARLIGDQPVILIMDEFSYAAESDPTLPSNLQAAWDHRFKERSAILLLAGSHIGMMVDLMGYHAPLYGRFTAQLLSVPLLLTPGRPGLVRRVQPAVVEYSMLAAACLSGKSAPFRSIITTALSQKRRTEPYRDRKHTVGAFHMTRQSAETPGTCLYRLPVYSRTACAAHLNKGQLV
jgi:hypothetical protein